jgi:CheY-like chemotaxis protein
MSEARIMIVEDERIVAEDIKEGLQNMGYAVTSVAKSGEMAIKMAENDRPDLVLMDIVLKGKMDGIETAKHFRSRFDIPVVYLNAQN